MPANVPDPRVAALAADVLASACRADPGLATWLGEHRYDGELPDPSAAARDARVGELQRERERAEAIAGSLDGANRGDLDVLTARISAELLHLRETREPDWNPMKHNPGSSLELLLTREFAPLPDRLHSVASRLAALADYFAAVRGRLSDMPAVHVRTANDQLSGLRQMCIRRVPDLARGTAGEAEVDAACRVATAAVDEHVRWLGDRPVERIEVRLGEEMFAAKLRWTLGTDITPAELSRHAHAELSASSIALADTVEQWCALTRRPVMDVRAALDELAGDVADDTTILEHCRQALERARAFVVDHDLVTVADDAIEIIELPQVDRGVAVAYCRPPGPLDTATLPTQFAVSPTPPDWSAARVTSFYREYNLHMLHDLTVHEAMPGHALQLAASRRGGTPVTRTWRNGTFVEGWAVYAEELMALDGFGSDTTPAAALAVRIQQLKMRLRVVINTLLDIGYHCDAMTEAEAMALMTGSGHQEDGEAAGKWRRAQLTSTQLSEYFTGYLEVAAVAVDLARARPGATTRARHDELLSHGSPPVPVLRRLLGLSARA